MYPYSVKPHQLWGLGAILVTLVVAVVAATLLLPPGDSRSSPAGSQEGTLAAGEETQVGCTAANGCPEGVRELDVYKLGMPIPADDLTVAEGSTMLFDYEEEKTESFPPYCEFSALDSNAGSRLQCRWEREYLEVPADLPPGEYGLKISIQQDEGADFYGFHISVEDGG